LGINDVPQSKIKAIAEALGVSVGTLLCWDEFDKKHDTEKIQNELNLIEQIERRHGKTAREAFVMYIQLDTLDQGKIIGKMEQMLEADKYSTNKKSNIG